MTLRIYPHIRKIFYFNFKMKDRTKKKKVITTSL